MNSNKFIYLVFPEEKWGFLPESQISTTVLIYKFIPNYIFSSSGLGTNWTASSVLII